jgi:hypothetical protein
LKCREVRRIGKRKNFRSRTTRNKRILDCGEGNGGVLEVRQGNGGNLEIGRGIGGMLE